MLEAPRHLPFMMQDDTFAVFFHKPANVRSLTFVLISGTKGVHLNELRLVCNNPFDGKSENNFRNTSVHLKSTEFELPVDVEERGAVEKDLCFVETPIQVYDMNRWIANINVLSALQNGNDAVRRNTMSFTGCSTIIPSVNVSIDNWEGLLEVPRGLGKLGVVVVRANDSTLLLASTKNLFYYN